MAFWRCYYHCVWTTNNRAALITSDLERIIVATVEEKSKALECPILAINTVSEHIHVAVCIPPKLAVAEWVRNAKGVSAHEANAMFPNLPSHFQWQQSYGVLTFGAKTLDFIVGYIQNQKEHHANNALEPYLERVDDSQ